MCNFMFDLFTLQSLSQIAQIVIALGQSLSPIAQIVIAISAAFSIRQIIKNKKKDEKMLDVMEKQKIFYEMQIEAKKEQIEAKKEQAKLEAKLRCLFDLMTKRNNLTEDEKKAKEEIKKLENLLREFENITPDDTMYNLNHMISCFPKKVDEIIEKYNLM